MNATTTSPAIIATADGGAHWSTVHLPHMSAFTGSLSSISCATTTSCLAVGSGAGTSGQPVLLAGAPPEQRWKLLNAPTGATGLDQVWCFTDHDCLVVGNEGGGVWSASTSDGGEQWTRGGSLSPPLSLASAMTCPTRSRCLVAGFASTGPGQGSGVIMVTNDGGVTWVAATVPPGTGPVTALTCLASTCIAAANGSTETSAPSSAKADLLASSDGGQTWAPHLPQPGIDEVGGISCTTADTCAVVGTLWAGAPPGAPTGDVVTTTDRGASWSAPPLAYVPTGLRAVSCPSARHCLAVGGDVTASVPVPVPARH